MKNWKDSLAAGLAVTLVAGLCAGLAPAAAQEEDEDERREQVRIAFSGGGAYLGVQILDVDGERASELGMSRPYGVYIDGVIDGEPAAEAGIEEGDVVVAWYGERVESVAELRRLVGETPPGRVVDLTVLRDGAEREVSVELGDRMGILSGARGLTFISPQIDLSRVYAPSASDARERARGLEERARELAVRVREAQEGVAEGADRIFYLAGRPRLGANTQSLGDQLAEYFGVEGGVLVTSVYEDTPAAEGGLRAGDVIVGLGDEDIDDPSDLRRALADLESGEVSVRIVRDGAEQTLTVELEDRERPFRWRRGVDELGPPGP
ncbi:PDZ domain-containing protein [Candidatus Palauibacter soopunensis]|uniref:PDZ domain-containing protein n=1 Tax=Candidatus Palauibacter soopunensis TaxID=3056739 RepID=UPI00238C1A44|nr:PDZ domain-containing protein [Candidatus Palauibacter soopunensis]MDE2878391.1 PDZ domain-containing protein [Candidatus Palauibacter soopunensis]